MHRCPWAEWTRRSTPGRFDSALPPRPDAGVDATIADAAVDAPLAVDAPIDAAPLPVTATVVGGYGYEQGVTIVWGDSTGAVISASTTSAQGTASQTVTAGAMVTALLGSPAYPSPTTIMGIEPGDNLVFIDYASIAALPMNVNIPTFPASPPTGTVDYALGTTGETFDGPPATYGLGGALGFGSTDAGAAAVFAPMLTAKDDNGNALGYVFAKNVPATTPDDAGALEVTLTGPWSTTFTTQQVVLENAPDAGLGGDWWSAYSEVADGIMLAPATLNLPDGGVPPEGNLIKQGHVGYADFVQTSTGFGPPGTSDYQGGVEVATRAAAPTADGTMTVDWSMLTSAPVITASTIDTTIPAQPGVTWTTSSGTLATSTGIIALAEWDGSFTDGGSQFGNWTIVSPGTAQSEVVAPQLPAGSAWAPAAGSNFNTSTVYAVQGGTALPTYAVFRAAANLFTLQTSCIGGPMAPPLPAAGTLVVTGFTSGGCG